MRKYLDFYKGKTVAVTGGGGYIASGLISILQRTPAQIFSVSRRDLPNVPGVLNIKADVCERKCWEEIVARADVIFHLAGNTSVYGAAKDPVGSLNSTLVPIEHLVAVSQDYARKPRVVFASTATVYGLTENFPISEDSPLVPVNNYDLHKLFAENQLSLSTKQGIIEGVSLRLANVYGVSSHDTSAEDRGILNKLTALALDGTNLTTFGGGEYLRDYVYLDDVARAFVIAGAEQKLIGSSFNIATGKSVSLNQAFHLVAERVEKATGKKVNVGNVPWPLGADPIEFRNFTADITKFKKITGWSPLIDLEEGVEMMIDYFLRKSDKHGSC